MINGNQSKRLNKSLINSQELQKVHYSLGQDSKFII